MIRAVAADGSAGAPWLKAGALVLAIHVGVLASVIGTRPRVESVASGPAITVEWLAAEPAAEPVEEPQPEPEVPPPPAPVTPPPPPVVQPPVEVPPVTAPLPQEVVAVSPPEPEPDPLPPTEPAPAPAEVATSAITPPTTIQSASISPAAAPAASQDPRARKREADYFSLVNAHLARKKRYPREARRARQQGVVTVRFTVHRDGRISGAEIRQSSGQALLDDATLDLLRRVSPLPRFPRGMDRDSVTLTLPIDYALRTD